ncbi:MAG: ribosome small subunit-dependent GTPase A [Ferruginibacter sp.]
MQARVYKSTGNWYQLKNKQGESFNARIIGKLKISGISSTNPIAVGDYVEIENQADIESTIITNILPRINYINRVSPHNKNQHHIIASNLDQSLLFATLKDPKTSFGFIDRFLVTSEAYHVPAIIVYNKADLFKKKEEEKFLLAKEIYEPLGYKIMRMSIENNEGVEEVKALLANKTTLLSGHSGVGKSTFLNTVFPDLKLRTKEVSGWSGKGLHTTTFAEMFDLPTGHAGLPSDEHRNGGTVIDTPGIREMGIADIPWAELAHYFPEMRALINECQFNNCMHLEEPGCAVKEAVNKGTVHTERYVSYMNILDTIEKKMY